MTPDRKVSSGKPRPPKRGALPRLGSMHEVAAELGVSRQRATLLASQSGFPAPAMVLAVGRLWLLDEVKGWAAVR